MLEVKTYVAKSSINGVGLFALEPIRKGQRIWRFTPGFDLLVPEKTVLDLTELQSEWLFAHACMDIDTRHYMLFADNMRYMNHSDTPNTMDVADTDIAIDDIKAGTELTALYTRFRRRLFPRN
jgi:hypothetical protein